MSFALLMPRARPSTPAGDISTFAAVTLAVVGLAALTAAGVGIGSIDPTPRGGPGPAAGTSGRARQGRAGHRSHQPAPPGVCRPGLRGRISASGHRRGRQLFVRRQAAGLQPRQQLALRRHPQRQNRRSQHPAAGQGRTDRRCRRRPICSRSSDPTDGHMKDVAEDGVSLGGLLVYERQLFGTGVIYYDANNTQTVSHFVRPLLLGERSAPKMVRVGQSGKTGFRGRLHGDGAARVAIPAGRPGHHRPVLSVDRVRTSLGPCGVRVRSGGSQGRQDRRRASAAVLPARSSNAWASGKRRTRPMARPRSWVARR